MLKTCISCAEKRTVDAHWRRNKCEKKGEKGVVGDLYFAVNVHVQNPAKSVVVVVVVVFTQNN